MAAHGPDTPPSSAPLGVEQLRELINDVVQPGHFFAAPTLALQWEHGPSDELIWEIYKGRLLDRTQTRQTRTLESWNIFVVDGEQRSAEPLLAVKLDWADQRLHVTRAILCHAWEGYDAGDNVYLSRETRKWVRELVGTIDLAHFATAQALRPEVAGLLFRAIVGVSRLPLTSVEAPLPAFTFGELAYCYQAGLKPTSATNAVQSVETFLERALAQSLPCLQKAKLLETLLRATPRTQIDTAALGFLGCWRTGGHRTDEIPRLLQALFDEVALSPWTDFVEKTLAFLRALIGDGQLGINEGVDFLSYLLRHLVRHLTAYDLHTFHHRGANYPDALLLDAALQEYLQLAMRQPALFTGAEPRGRLRRRALRQAWLLRRYYEGHRVPDAPTSPGENARLLPPPHGRVPEEQILHPERRRRRLFLDDAETARQSGFSEALLRQSMQDLRHPPELQELGMALFLDRPLGVFKAPGELDETLLLSYEAFSPGIAERRLRWLCGIPELVSEAEVLETGLQALRSGLPVRGISLQPRSYRARPEIVSLDDALKVADDFVLLRTTRRAVADFLAQFDFAPLGQRFSLDYLGNGQRVLILRRADIPGVLTVYDSELRLRLEVQVCSEQGYAQRGGAEYPVAGLRVLRVWEPDERREYDLSAEEPLLVVPSGCLPHGQ